VRIAVFQRLALWPDMQHPRDTCSVGPVGQVQWVAHTGRLFMCSDKYGQITFLF